MDRPSFRQRVSVRYFLPVAATAATLLLRISLNPVLGDRASLSPFLIGVVVSAWFGGFGPAALATGLGVVVRALWLPHRLGEGVVTFVPVGVFAFEGLLIGWLSGLCRPAQARAEASERAHRRGAAFQSVVLDVALDCMIGMDADGKVVEWNPAAERTFGYARQEAVGRQLADLIVPSALRDQHRQGLARYIATGESRILGRRLEMTARRADGDAAVHCSRAGHQPTPP